MPAGMSTFSVVRLARRPRPWHSRHGRSAMRPSPPQVSHAIVRTTWPNGVRVTAWRWPVPLQRSQLTMGVPGSAPLPLQCSQRAIASNVTSTVEPFDAVTRSISTVAPTSPPCDEAVRPPLPPKNASKMSASDPNAEKSVGAYQPARRPSKP